MKQALRYFLTFLFVVCFFNGFSQYQLSWHYPKSYPSSQSDGYQLRQGKGNHIFALTKAGVYKIDGKTGDTLSLLKLNTILQLLAQAIPDYNSGMQLFDFGGHQNCDFEIDANENICLLGSYNSLQNQSPIFTMTIDSTNHLKWARSFYKQGNSNYNYPISIELDSYGNIYSLIKTNVGNPFEYLQGAIHLIKYDSLGSVSWEWDSSSIVPNNFFTPVDLKVVASGVIIYGGKNIYFPSSGLTHSQSSIIKLKSNGIFHWEDNYNYLSDLTGETQAIGCYQDSIGNFHAICHGYKAGQATITFRKLDTIGSVLNSVLVSNVNFQYWALKTAFNRTTADVFVAGADFLLKVNSAYVIQWQRSLQYTHTHNSWDNLNLIRLDLELDKDGSAYVLGVLPNPNSYWPHDVMVKKYSTQGLALDSVKYFETATYYSSEIAEPYDMILDKDKGIYIVGTFDSKYPLFVRKYCMPPTISSYTNKLTLCLGDSLHTSFKGDSTFSYYWQPDTFITSNKVLNPTFYLNTTTTYTLTVSNETGCINNYTVDITVLSSKVKACSDQSIVKGQSIKLAASNASSYSWSPTASLNDSLLISPIASPTITTSYVVMGTTTANGYNCYTYDTTIVNVSQDTSFKAPYDWAWIKAAGSSGDQQINSMTNDSLGNLIVFGRFQNSITLGSYNLTSNGGYDLFIAKFDSSGNCLWAINEGGANDEVASEVKVDQFGQIYITGFYYGNSKFNGTALIGNSTSYESLYLAKYSNQGTFKWVKSATSTANVQGKALCIDTKNNQIYLGGHYSKTATFQGGAFTLTNYNYIQSLISKDIFWLKCDTSGNIIWVKKGGGTKEDDLYDISISPFNEIYLLGSYQSVASFGSYVPPNVFARGVILKADTAGNIISGNTYGCNSGFTYQNIRFIGDTSGVFYICGFGAGDSYFDSFTINNVGSPYFYVAKYNKSSTCIWAKAFEANHIATIGSVVAQGFEIDTNNDLIFSGYLQGTTNFSPYSISSFSNQNGFIAKCDKDANYLWAKTICSPGKSFSSALSVDRSNNIYVAGGYTETSFFNLNKFSSVGGEDYFIGKLNSNGVIPTNTQTPVNIQSNTLSVFPNPTLDRNITIRYDHRLPSEVVIEVVNVINQSKALLYQSKEVGGAYEKSFILPSDLFKSGIYFIKTTIGNSVSIAKLIVID